MSASKKKPNKMTQLLLIYSITVLPGRAVRCVILSPCGSELQTRSSSQSFRSLSHSSSALSNYYHSDTRSLALLATQHLSKRFLKEYVCVIREFDTMLLKGKKKQLLYFLRFISFTVLSSWLSLLINGKHLRSCFDGWWCFLY